MVPSAAGTYLGLIVGSFVLLEFPRHPKVDLTMSPVVYVQGYTGGLYLERPEEIEQFVRSASIFGVERWMRKPVVPSS